MKPFDEIVAMSVRPENNFMIMANGDDGFSSVVGYQPPKAGAFKRKPVRMGVICSWGMGWEHISVSLQKRTPTWGELEHVRHLFAKPDEVWMQLHVPAEDHINIKETCLHMWRPLEAEIPLPPKFMV